VVIDTLMRPLSAVGYSAGAQWANECGVSVWQPEGAE